jgi:hypothetical protein
MRSHNRSEYWYISLTYLFNFPEKTKVFFGRPKQKKKKKLGQFSAQREALRWECPALSKFLFSQRSIILPQGRPLGRKLSQFFLFFLFGPAGKTLVFSGKLKDMSITCACMRLFVNILLQ